MCNLSGIQSKRRPLERQSHQVGLTADTSFSKDTP